MFLPNFNGFYQKIDEKQSKIDVFKHFRVFPKSSPLRLRKLILPVRGRR